LNNFLVYKTYKNQPHPFTIIHPGTFTIKLSPPPDSVLLLSLAHSIMNYPNYSPALYLPQAIALCRYFLTKCEKQLIMKRNACAIAKAKYIGSAS